MSLSIFLHVSKEGAVYIQQCAHVHEGTLKQSESVERLEVCEGLEEETGD